jgi:hypothetical protein
MLVEAMVLAMFSGDVWALVFLALMLKIPLIGLAVALWFAIKRHDEIKPEVVPLRSQMALCGYCGTRITVGYDANLLHEQAHRIGTRTGEAVFDVESRLVRESLRQPNHYASPGARTQRSYAVVQLARGSGSGVSRASIASRSDSSHGGRITFDPSWSSGRSTVKPGPSSAIS